MTDRLDRTRTAEARHASRTRAQERRDKSARLFLAFAFPAPLSDLFTR